MEKLVKGNCLWLKVFGALKGEFQQSRIESIS